MRDLINGLHFFGRFAYSFSRLGYKQRRLLWTDPPGDFHGQHWLISGASGGIGRAIATAAAERELLANNAVIINMTSGGMYNVPLRVDRLNELNPERYDGVQVYAYHKRAQVELNAWWRRRHADRGWQFYVMHPGWVDTQGVKTSLPGFRALFKHVLRDAAAGADTAVWLAAARPPQEDDGSIWFDREERPAHIGQSTLRNADDAEELIDFLQQCNH